MTENTHAPQDDNAAALPDDAHLETIEQERDEYLQGWKRARADYENLRKELDARSDDALHYRTGEIMADALPVRDLFETALAYVPESSKKEPWFQGFTQIQKEFDQFLTRYGVTRFVPEGSFDPNEHEAVDQITDGSAEPGAIMRVVTPGYRFRERLLRPAKVIIASDPKSDT